MAATNWKRHLRHDLHTVALGREPKQAEGRSTRGRALCTQFFAELIFGHSVTATWPPRRQRDPTGGCRRGGGVYFEREEAFGDVIGDSEVGDRARSRRGHRVGVSRPRPTITARAASAAVQRPMVRRWRSECAGTTPSRRHADGQCSGEQQRHTHPCRGAVLSRAGKCRALDGDGLTPRESRYRFVEHQ